MSESLPAINIEELTDAVNAVVNMKQKSLQKKSLRNIAPRTDSTTIPYRPSYLLTNDNTCSVNNQIVLNPTENKIPVMVSVQPPENKIEALCLSNIDGGYNKVSSINDGQTTAGSSIPLSVILSGDTSSMIDINNQPLPPFTTQTFSSQGAPDLSNLDNCHIYNTTSQSDISTAPQVQTSSPSTQTALSNLIFSPSDTNTTSRFFMSSPLPIFSVDTPIPSVNSYLPRPSSVVSNISGISVFDSLLKSHDSGQFLAPLPPVTPDKTSSNIAKLNNDVSRHQSILPDYYCVTCANCVYTECKHHPCDYKIIQDKPVLTRAVQTLPEHFSLQPSKICGHFTDSGIFARDFIPQKIQFGPLVGTRISDGVLSEVNVFRHWKIFYQIEEDVKYDIIDISEENNSNWLMFMKPARNREEQNVIAYQAKDCIMFVTIKDIEPQEELLFWYSKEYAQHVGFMPKPNRLKYCPYCTTCNEIFPDRITLIKHQRQEHNEIPIKKHKCNYCDKRFVTIGKVKKHILTTHTNIRPFKCLECGKQFADKSNLRGHEKIHSGEREFKCTLCEKTFRQKAHLTSHMYIHTKIKGVPCPHCDKMFSRKADMTQHSIIHTQEKMYQCEQCSKIFYKQQTYKKHLKIHTNEKNYKCDSCQKKFHTKYHLQRHYKSCKSLKMNTMLDKLSERHKNKSEENSICIEELTSCQSKDSSNHSNNNCDNINNILPSCDTFTMNSIHHYNIGLVDTGILNTIDNGGEDCSNHLVPSHQSTNTLPSISHVVCNTSTNLL